MASMTTIELVDIASVSETGHVRTRNEDRVFTSSSLIAVADGMGGHDAGDQAASIVVNYLASLSPGERVSEDIQAAMERAARDMAELSDAGAGSTLAGFIAVDPPLTCHVGDSRVYRFRAGESEPLLRLTRDHSFVQGLVDRGEITDAEAHLHPRRNIITRAIGSSSEPQVEFTRADVIDGDLVMVCSDGLSDELMDVEIERIIESGYAHGTAAIAAALCETALAAGGRDNVSVVLARVSRFGTGAASPQLAN